MAFWVARLDVCCSHIRKQRKWFHFLAGYVLWDDREKSLISKGMQSKVNVHCTIEYEVTVFFVNSMPNWYFEMTNLCIASSQLGNEQCKYHMTRRQSERRILSPTCYLGQWAGTGEALVAVCSQQFILLTLGNSWVRTWHSVESRARLSRFLSECWE